MPIKTPFTLKNFNATIDGDNQAGLLLEISVPEITIKTGIHKVGGTVVVVPMGIDSPPKLTFTTAEYGKLQKHIGKFDDVRIMGYGSLNDNSQTTKKVEMTAEGIISYKPSKWSAGQGTKDVYEMNCNYVQYSGNGGSLTYDGKGNSLIVDGEDLIETIRGKIKT
ncbi:MAG: phage major tail tube protein [Thiotrichaceae bacterium]|nr:phage major tail tube protein [Thiotrichaceae bacterium]